MEEPLEHPGYTGCFTRDRYPLAKFDNGQRVVKVKEEDGDTHPVGSCATVLGSIGHPDIGVGYFVEWDDLPRVAVFVVEWKLGPWQ